MAAKNAIPAGMYKCKWRDSETLKKKKPNKKTIRINLSYLNASL